MFDTLHLGVVTVGFIFTVGVVLATACFGRFFCGWGCHILALQDLSAWCLAKIGVNPRPLRSRTLAWAPVAAAIYLFVWPQVERLLHGHSLPELSIVTDRDEWTSFTTDDLLRSFLGIALTLVTLSVCGFAIVYFLGSRSFCSYACPYGALFAGVERTSPRRIVASAGSCTNCGLCIASCKSGVRVIEEVRNYGSVVDSSCFKDLDCVSVCPTNAIELGWATPPALRRLKVAEPKDKRYDFNLREEGLLSIVFLATVLVSRGLYGSISFLLALAIASLAAYAAVVGWRFALQSNYSFHGRPWKIDGKLTRTGRLAAVLLTSLGALLANSTVVRFHEARGESAIARLAHLEAQGADEASRRAEAASALGYLQEARRWAPVVPGVWRTQMAALYLRLGKTNESRREANAVLASDPGNQAGQLLVAQSWLADGRIELARQQALAIVADTERRYGQGPAPLSHRRVLAGAYFLLGDVAGRLGDRTEAREYFESAVASYSKHADAQLALGLLYAEAGRCEEARAAFNAVLLVRPADASAKQALSRLRG
ncbi:tetratricopeptide repeat protein [Botrimarina mediterranea]|uniref:Electron transport protein YccM n=1 Tax=Botrimarina mediterranea TaxID=2528022 RepID=A0A518KA23_9BACT|nr:tetratricopeptide repeat protein [Botrimarina mediterranea]QDV74647.1 Putative electron transport protein YccM [Botrimarina mediterranea]